MSDDNNWLTKELKKNRKDRRLIYVGSVIGICLLIGITGLVYHSAKHNASLKLSSNSYTAPSDTGNDTLTIRGSTAISTPSSNSSTQTDPVNPTPNANKSSNSDTSTTNQVPVYTKLQPTDLANYGNLFTLLNQMDGDMTDGSYAVAYQVSVTNSNSVFNAASKVNPSSMSNYTYYSSSISLLIGEISAQLPTLESDYNTSITDFENYNSSSDQNGSSAQIVLQNAQSQLVAGRNALSQIQGYYNQIPQ